MLRHKGQWPCKLMAKGMAEAIAKSKTIMWNGPKDMMNKISLVTSTVAITIIGREGTVTR